MRKKEETLPILYIIPYSTYLRSTYCTQYSTWYNSHFNGRSTANSITPLCLDSTQEEEKRIFFLFLQCVFFLPRLRFFSQETLAFVGEHFTQYIVSSFLLRTVQLTNCTSYLVIPSCLPYSKVTF